jgi:hypothetical protein
MGPITIVGDAAAHQHCADAAEASRAVGRSRSSAQRPTQLQGGVKTPKATILQRPDVQRPTDDRLYGSSLDVDLSRESLRKLGRFLLVSRSADRLF